jgi:hypothetical protein
MTITIRIDRRFILTICALISAILIAILSTMRQSNVAIAASATATPCLLPKVIEPRITMAASQLMENGWIIWIGDTRQLLILSRDNPSATTGTVEVYQENWEPGMPEVDPSLKPPGTYWQPSRGIGKLWRENTNVRSKMGWGVKNSEGYMMVLTVDGDKMWFNGPDWAFKIVGNRWQEFYAWR